MSPSSRRSSRRFRHPFRNECRPGAGRGPIGSRQFAGMTPPPSSRPSPARDAGRSFPSRRHEHAPVRVLRHRERVPRGRFAHRGAGFQHLPQGARRQAGDDRGRARQVREVRRGAEPALEPLRLALHVLRCRDRFEELRQPANQAQVPGAVPGDRRAAQGLVPPLGAQALARAERPQALRAERCRAHRRVPAVLDVRRVDVERLPRGARRRLQSQRVVHEFAGTDRDANGPRDAVDLRIRPDRQVSQRRARHGLAIPSLRHRRRDPRAGTS
jgi:hypothetical protein